MSKSEPPTPKLRQLAALVLGVTIVVAAAPCGAQDECLVEVRDAIGNLADNGTLCGEAEQKKCVFRLQVCLNQGDSECAPAAMKKKAKAKGSCALVGRLRAKPDSSNPVCGSSVDIKVKTKKRGTHEGKCKLTVAARSTDRPARRDVDRLILVCKPNPGDCPARIPVTTTTLPPCVPACSCCVLPVSDVFYCVSP